MENFSGDICWIVHDRTAIGDYMGVIEINISKNSFSSSVLPMLNSHSDLEPNSVYIGSEKISVITLDSIADKYLNKSSNCFIKIDTQVMNGRFLMVLTKLWAKQKVLYVNYPYYYMMVNNFGEK